MDPDAAARFDRLYDESFRRLVGQVTALTGDVGESQDVCQEAFVRAWQRWDRVAGLDAPEAWVRRVALRLAVSRWRRARTRAAALARSGPVPDVPALHGDRVDLARAMRTLPAAQREALVLHHVAGLAVAEVAAQVGCPEGTVKARLSRGRRALAARLAEQPEASPSPPTCASAAPLTPAPTSREDSRA